MLDNIYSGEIYVESRCLERENVIRNLLKDLLDHYGFVAIDESGRRWQRGNQLAIVCLVDDFNVCGANRSNLPNDWFDSTTVVLTDNHILFAPQYEVLELPRTFYSTFAYVPKLNVWQPERDFHLPMNRGDTQRLTIFNEFWQQRGLLDTDFVNYNAAHTAQAPFRNHYYSIEEASIKSYINLVVETYAGDNTITFSEKTFRALQTPAPWMLFACRTGVEYLRNIGFDVLDDLIEHSYDSVFQTGVNGIDKISNWVSCGLKNLESIKSKPVDLVQQRCYAAAMHNQQLLQKWKVAWPADFVKWLDNTLQVLNN